MTVEYKNKIIKRICTDRSFAKRKYSEKTVQTIHRRIDQLSATGSIEELIQSGIGRCHPLTADRKGQYAMSIDKLSRLIFEARETRIAVLVIEIVDYH